MIITTESAGMVTDWDLETETYQALISVEKQILVKGPGVEYWVSKPVSGGVEVVVGVDVILDIGVIVGDIGFL